MTATVANSVQTPPAAQTAALSQLVDLEARWENLRGRQSMTPGIASNLKELHQKQKAYEAFFTKLVAYNKGYKPAHVPELLLNNAPRLALWCRRMRDLQIRVQFDADAHYPVHLLEKAYRWADRLADRLKVNRIIRPSPCDKIAAAIGELEELAQWCENFCSDKVDSARSALAG